MRPPTSRRWPLKYVGSPPGRARPARPAALPRGPRRSRSSARRARVRRRPSSTSIARGDGMVTRRSRRGAAPASPCGTLRCPPRGAARGPERKAISDVHGGRVRGGATGRLRSAREPPPASRAPTRAGRRAPLGSSYAPSRELVVAQVGRASQAIRSILEVSPPVAGKRSAKSAWVDRLTATATAGSATARPTASARRP